jgi:hypothetical protein
MIIAEYYNEDIDPMNNLYTKGVCHLGNVVGGSRGGLTFSADVNKYRDMVILQSRRSLRGRGESLV